MRRTTAVTLVSLTALTLAAALLWSGVLTRSPANATTNGSTLSFDVKFAPFFSLDFSANGVREVTVPDETSPSVGDESIFQDQLLRSGTVVGHDGGVCTITHVDLAATPPLDIACQ